MLASLVLKRWLMLVVLASSAVSGIAQAALTLSYEQSADGKAATIIFTMDGAKLKVESLTGERLQREMIYDAGTIELTVFAAEQGTYVRLSEADAKAIERLGVQGPPEVRYEKVGARKTISGYACEVYRVFIGPALRNEGCFAPYAADVVTREEAEHLGELKAGLQRFLRARGETRGAPGLAMEQKFFLPDGKTVRTTMMLKSLSHRPVPASAFRLPPNAKLDANAPKVTASPAQMMADIQRSHIEGNVPAPADFNKFLERDLAAYFGRAAGKKVAVDFELLREGPTQSGVSYPKFYAWVRVAGGKSASDRGAVRLAAIDKTRFEISEFVSEAAIRKEPSSIYRLFPGPVCDRIKSKLPD
jgi:hypothetical protein